ncbi:MAG TPA: DOPA 4,5-dioxygenase family protein [Rudaea sp.]|nr:DOPA 4,5-dioxygenase family protein [Rudaea sp.]
MDNDNAPYHAHIYYTTGTRAAAQALQQRFLAAKGSGEIPGLLFVGALRDRKVGPHPIPQFEIHFPRAMLPLLQPLLEASGLTVLVHPLTDDDLADHTTLGHWIGQPLPLPLDLATLDPPGMNQGIARYGKTDF